MIFPCLKMRAKEEGALLWIVIKIIVILLAFLVSGNYATGLAILISGHIFFGYFAASFHNRIGLTTLLSGDSNYMEKKNRLLILASMVENFPFGVATLLYVFCVGENFSLLCIVYSALLFFFVNSVANFVGICVKKTIVGMMLCTILASFNFIKLLVQEEYCRWFAPVVQIGNMNRIQWWNLTVLFILSIVMVLYLIFRRQIVMWLGILSIIAVVITDVLVSRDDVLVSDTYECYVREALEKISELNEECGLPVFDTIEVRKSVYYPWESNKEKIVFRLEGQCLYMNCFTESLCNMSEEEILMRATYSVLKPQSRLQEIMVELYMQQLLGNTEYVEQFLKAEQIKQYGEVVSPNYGFVADVLVSETENFGKLYMVVKECNTVQEVPESWRDSDD